MNIGELKETQQRKDQYGDADFCNYQRTAVPALVVWP